ncbi:MAG: DUF2079 domain-containing protein [bacterium]
MMLLLKKIKENYTPIVFSIIYTIIFSIATILRYKTFHASFLDLGVEMHVIYRIAHGHFTSYGTHIIYGSGYIEPLYFLLGFLYKLIPHVSFLLILQSFLIGISAFPFYWLYKEIIGNKGAYLAPLFLLLNPQLHTGNMFDFHVSVFYVPFISFTLYFAKNKKYFLLYLFLFLTLITKIDSFVYAIGVCVFMVLLDYKNKHAYILFSISIIYGLSAIFVIFPHINYDAYNALITNGGTYMGKIRYPILDYGVKDLSRFNFAGFLKSIFIPLYNNIHLYFKFILFLLLSLIFLPLFAGKYLLIVIPALMVNYIAIYSFQSEFVLQYSFYIIPFFVLASIYGIKNIKQKFLYNLHSKKVNNHNFLSSVKLFNITLLGMLIVIPYIIQNYSQLNYNKMDNIFNFKIYTLDKNININTYKAALKKIPENSITSVSMYAYPWDFKEKKVYLFPQMDKNVKYIIASTCVQQQIYHNNYKKLIKNVDSIIKRGKFKIIYHNQCSIILKRKVF